MLVIFAYVLVYVIIIMIHNDYKRMKKVFFLLSYVHILSIGKILIVRIRGRLSSSSIQKSIDGVVGANDRNFIIFIQIVVECTFFLLP